MRGCAVRSRVRAGSTGPLVPAPERPAIPESSKAKPTVSEPAEAKPARTAKPARPAKSDRTAKSDAEANALGLRI